MNNQMQMLHVMLEPLDGKFKRINWGGCGCVAAMLATKLRHEFPIMRITSTDVGGSNDLDIIRELLTDSLVKSQWNENGVHFGHVWVGGSIC